MFSSLNFFFFSTGHTTTHHSTPLRGTSLDTLQYTAYLQSPVTSDMMYKETLFYLMFLSWTLLSFTNPAVISNDFFLLFTSAAAVRAVWALAAFSFAPGLLSVLRSPVPPTIAWFKTLPSIVGQLLWAVYALVLEKEGCRPRVYIGSGTDSKIGVARRFTAYDRRCLKGQTGRGDNQIPIGVEKALKEGYTITHMGLLIWIPLPPPAYQQALRGLFLDLEALCTFHFWAMRSKVLAWGMPIHIMLWPRESFTYDGCYGHFSLNEGFSYDPSLTNFTSQEINAMALARKKAKNKMYIANKGVGVHAARCKATREKALDAQRYKCDTCVLTFPNNAKLKAHIASSSHIDKVNSKGRRTNGRGGGQRAIEARKFWCEVCQHAAPSQKRLDTHMVSKPHAKKLRVLAGKAANELLNT